MTDQNQRQVPDADEAIRMAFAEIPYIPAASASSTPTSRLRSLIVIAIVATAVIGMVVAYYFRPTNRVDPNAPRIVVEVSGMHCPIQCGLRVASSLENLPFVLPGSLTANPKTGIVTFAASNAEAVDEQRIRRAIEKAGFGFRSIKTAEAPSHGDRSNARTLINE